MQSPPFLHPFSSPYLQFQRYGRSAEWTPKAGSSISDLGSAVLCGVAVASTTNPHGGGRLAQWWPTSGTGSSGQCSWVMGAARWAHVSRASAHGFGAPLDLPCWRGVPSVPVSGLMDEVAVVACVGSCGRSGGGGLPCRCSARLAPPTRPLGPWRLRAQQSAHQALIVALCGPVPVRGGTPLVYVF